MKITRAARVVPLARLVAAGQIVLLARRHWHRLEPDERRRLITLLVQVPPAPGRRRPLAPSERAELARLIAKARPAVVRRSLVAQRFSPVPLPAWDGRRGRGAGGRHGAHAAPLRRAGTALASGRSEAGYRLYGNDDLARLREILIWRALGFPLGDIAALLDEAGHDRLAALERQRELIEREIDRLGTLVAAVDAAIAAQRNGTELEVSRALTRASTRTRRGSAGGTDAYRESAGRPAIRRGRMGRDPPRVRGDCPRAGRADAGRRARRRRPGAGSGRAPPRAHLALVLSVLAADAPRTSPTSGFPAPTSARPRLAIHDAILANADGGDPAGQALMETVKAVIPMCPGWAATRSSQARMAG